MKSMPILFASSLLLLSISSLAQAEKVEEKASLADTLASEAKETKMKDQQNAEENSSEDDAANNTENETEPSVTANTLSNREVDNLAEQVTTDLEQLLSGKKDEAVKKEDVEKVVEKAKEQGNSSGDIQKAVLEALDELQEKGVEVKQETLSFVQESMGDILNEGSEDAMGDPASIYIQSLNAELAGTDVKKPEEKEVAQADKAKAEGEGSEEKVDVDKVASAIATNLASNKAMQTDVDKPEAGQADQADPDQAEASEVTTSEDTIEETSSTASTESTTDGIESKSTEETAENTEETSAETSTAALPDVDGEKVAESIAKTVDGQISMATQKGPKGTITVVHGESLSNIAKRIYGETKYYQVIFDANRDVLDDPNMVKVGQILKIPPKPE